MTLILDIRASKSATELNSFAAVSNSLVFQFGYSLYSLSETYWGYDWLSTHFDIPPASYNPDHKQET
jgi:hypothetical protein